MKKLLLILLLFALNSNAQLNDGYTSSLVENGFFKPMQMIMLGDKQIVCEKEGDIYVMDNFVKRDNPIISEEPYILSESGLLSIVTDGTYLWAYMSQPGSPRYGAVKRYSLDIDNNTATFEDEPFNDYQQSGSNHQGGMLFLYEGWMYLTLGDSGNRWSSRQDSSNRGKIIRFNPFTGEGHPDNPLFDADNPKSPESLQYAKGFRNPWRPIMHEGKLYVATVGEGDEETMYLIDEAGKNGRWPFFEGWHDTEYTVPNNPDTGQPYVLENEVEPLFSYTQNDQGFRISETETIDYEFNGVSIIALGVLDGFGHECLPIFSVTG
jgi:glucose/arabinose dehydrogenase